MCFYCQFRRRHHFPPHKIPPPGDKYCYYQVRRRHYQFRRKQRRHFIGGGFLIRGGRLYHSHGGGAFSLKQRNSKCCQTKIPLSLYIYIYKNNNSKNYQRSLRRIHTSHVVCIRSSARRVTCEPCRPAGFTRRRRARSQFSSWPDILCILEPIVGSREVR